MTPKKTKGKKTAKITKLYIGRLFTLRNGNISYAGEQDVGVYCRGGHIRGNNEDAVMIVDESSKRVKIVHPDVSRPVWISKFYLHHEIEEMRENPVGEISNVVDNISLQITRLNRSEVKDEKIVKSLQKIMSDLRAIQNSLTKGQQENDEHPKVSS